MYCFDVTVTKFNAPNKSRGKTEIERKSAKSLYVINIVILCGAAYPYDMPFEFFLFSKIKND